MKTNRHFSTYLLFLLGLTFISGATMGQTTIPPLDNWEAQVIKEFRRYESQLDLSGQTHQLHFGRIKNNENEFVNVTLKAGITYYILGVCDNDCTDLDLELFNRSDLVDRDFETDAYPLVTVTPARETTYRIKVLMESCNVDPCRYGVAVYSK
jgi:hypothetical protein